MEKLKNQREPIPISSASYYRDELNFAEFPLATLGARGGTESLVFEDRVFDKGANKLVTRRLTVSPSSKFGLPTALDEEVLLGLLQLTAKGEFSSRTVSFSRYELLEELGWSQQTSSYKRVDEALKKWLGVTLYYDNAWWDKEAKSWVSEAFHVIESVTLIDKERRGKGAKRSSFTWNENVYRSFEAGYLKKIDFELFKSLESHVAKRIYRFLDKRFFHKDSWSFDLRDFACEHIGLPRSFSNSKIKERLAAGISELEAKGFLAKLSDEDRFRKLKRGEWKIHFVKAGARKEKAAEIREIPKREDLPLALKTFMTLSEGERESIKEASLLLATPGELRLLAGSEQGSETAKALRRSLIVRYLGSQASRAVGE